MFNLRLTRDLELAVEILRGGGIVAYPTDTLYGLAADPRSVAAVRRLFAVKARATGHPVPLVASTLEQAQLAAAFNQSARRLASSFWPGPLSLVLPATQAILPEVAAGDGSVAIRVPAHPVAQSLAAGLGFCITATSANLSGKPPSTSASAVARSLGDRIDLVLDGDDTPGGAPSTIVDVRGGAVRLVRAGAIEWERVLRSIE